MAKSVTQENNKRPRVSATNTDDVLDREPALEIAARDAFQASHDGMHAAAAAVLSPAAVLDDQPLQLPPTAKEIVSVTREAVETPLTIQIDPRSMYTCELHHTLILLGLYLLANLPAVDVPAHLYPHL